MKTKILAIAAIALFGLQSCGSKKGAEAVAQLANGSWELAEINSKPINPNDFAKIPTLNFSAEEGRVSGNSGCNQMSGTYKIVEDKISFGPIAGTKMACEGTGENQFFTAFNTVQAFKVKSNKLRLFDGLGNEAAVFIKKG